MADQNGSSNNAAIVIIIVFAIIIVGYLYLIQPSAQTTNEIKKEIAVPPASK